MFVIREDQQWIVIWRDSHESLRSLDRSLDSGKVMRNNVVQISYLDEDGNPRKAEATGYSFNATQQPIDLY